MPKDNSADAMQTQVNAGQVAAEYLRRLDPAGAHNLVAFDPTSGGPSHGRTFAGGAFVDVEAWVNERDGHFNIYYTVNEVRPDFQGVKPTKDDIVSIRAVFADADPEPGDLDAKRAEVLERLQGINALADADLIDSGGGFQLIVIIEEKLPVDALSREWAESYGRGLAAQLGSDAVQNIDRLMRLPGAMNIPTPAKRAKGRVPRRATVLRPHARTFPKAEIDGAVMPKKQAQADDNSPRIAEVIDQIRYSGYTEADTFEQLPAALQEKFRLAVSTDPKLATLWSGHLPPDAEDVTGSTYRWRLALALGRAGHFTAAEYACLAFTWPYVVQAGRDKYFQLSPEGDGPRELARCWVKAAEPAIERTERLRDLFGEIYEPSDANAFEPKPGPPRAMFFDASTLAGKEAPTREWVVQDLVPSGVVTLFSGDGGTGKSLLALQLAVAVASGTQWVGMDAKQGTSVFLSAEDDHDELHRRLSSVARVTGVEVADLANLKVSSLAGEDALLAALSGSLIVATQLYKEIDTYLATVGPTLVVLDTSADLFGGNENDRAQVRRFVGLLGHLAIKHRCAVMLLSHPSNAGMATGTGLSGSTAWNGSVRSRLYMERVKIDSYEADPNLRRLTNKKANYGPTGQEIMLRWRCGAFTNFGTSEEKTDEVSGKVEQVFLKLLDMFTDQARYVNHAGGPTYAPKMMAEAGAASEGITQRGFKIAMGSLLTKGLIRVAVHGSAAKQRQHLERVK